MGVESWQGLEGMNPKYKEGDPAGWVRAGAHTSLG